MYFPILQLLPYSPFVAKTATYCRELRLTLTVTRPLPEISFGQFIQLGTNSAQGPGVYEALVSSFKKMLIVFKPTFLPARASEQGNVIGSVRIYMCVQKKIVIERTRDLIYLKFVATDFFPKIISPSAGENSGDLA